MPLLIVIGIFLQIVSKWVKCQKISFATRKTVLNIAFNVLALERNANVKHFSSLREKHGQEAKKIAQNFMWDNELKPLYEEIIA